VLIISVCKDKLSELEFVKPVKEILGKNWRIIKYKELEEKDIENSKAAVICGTALKDWEYIENIDKFSWIKNYKKPLLGICAGAQIIGKLFGLNLIKKTMIGKFKMKVEEDCEIIKKGYYFVYCLFSAYVEPNKEFKAYAFSKNIPLILIKNNFYLLMFHPEVLNKDILKNFKSMV